MKSKLAAALAALLAVALLSGCGSGGTPQPTEAPAAETPAPDTAAQSTPQAVETPTPTAEPAALLEPEAFTYTEVVNETLGVQFDCPGNWDLNPARKTLRYDEPTPGGATPAQLAITYTTLTKKPDADVMKKQMTRFLDLLRQQYGSVNELKTSNKETVMGNPAYMQRYVAANGDEQVLGIAYLVYTAEGKRLYLVHFSAASDRYDALTPIWQSILASIKRVGS